MGGDVFVVQGDITQIHADAIVLSSSTQLDGGGLAQQSFLAHFGDAFCQGFAAIQDSHPPGPNGRRAQPGDAFWIPLGGKEDRLRGIVVVVATGREHRIEQRAQLAVRGAMAEARRRLRELFQGENKTPGPLDRWLIAFPTVGLGGGGYTREILAAAESLVRTARDEAREPEDVGGLPVPIDVVFVTFTPISYQVFLLARRRVEAEPPCPLPTPEAAELLESVRDGRCVLFAGAGLSRPAGLPDWSALLHEMAAELKLELADDIDQYPLDFSLDLAQWYADRFAREKLDAFIHERFADTARRSPVVRPTLAHYFLAMLPFRLFLTTNYDDLVERTLRGLRRDPEVVCRPEEVVRTGQAERPCVVKLHGDANHRTRIVLTRDDFDGFFRDHPVTAALLEGLLLNQTFLFVGYELRDPNTRQVYSRVAHLLRQANRRAYTVVVRDEDGTSRFYEEQWRRQGLITLRMPPDPGRVHNSLRFFDWLARHASVAPGLFLMTELREEGLPPDLQGLDQLRARLQEVIPPLETAIQGLACTDQPERTRLLAHVLDLLTTLGWRPSPGHWQYRLWERLAQGCGDTRERQRLLRRALAVAEQEGILADLRRRLDGGTAGP